MMAVRGRHLTDSHIEARRSQTDAKGVRTGSFGSQLAGLTRTPSLPVTRVKGHSLRRILLSMNRIVVFTGNAHQALARDICTSG